MKGWRIVEILAQQLDFGPRALRADHQRDAFGRQPSERVIGGIGPVGPRSEEQPVEAGEDNEGKRRLHGGRTIAEGGHWPYPVQDGIVGAKKLEGR